MNISDKGPLHDLAGLLSGLHDAPQVKNNVAKEAPKLQGEDQVRISSRAKEFHQALELVKQAPDVREQKVAEIQAKIESGTYNVRGEQVADKLIQHTILDAIL